MFLLLVTRGSFPSIGAREAWNPVKAFIWWMPWLAGGPGEAGWRPLLHDCCLQLQG